MASRRRLEGRFAFASHAVHHHRRRRPVLEVLEGRALLSTFTINSVGDAGSGSGNSGDLRYCINQANADNQANTIVFDATVFSTPQTITLSGSQLELSDTGGTQTITGPAAGVTISGGGMSRVFEVDSGVTASLSGLTISGGSVSSGNGGGLANYGGNVTLTGCTLSGNSAGSLGGGLDTSGGTATLTNCTVVSNTASVSGGGIEAQGPVTVLSSTFSANHAIYGGAIDNNQGEYTITVGDSILAGDSASYGPNFCNGVTSLGNNLIGNASDSSGWISSDLTGVNALLAPLGNYGGPTQTMALLPGSPAIDAGNNTLIPAGVTTDQRGLPRIVNSIVDIGAFESQGFTLTPVAGSTPQSATIGTPFANPLAVTLRANNPVEPVDGDGVSVSVSFVAQPAANGATALLQAPSAVIAGGQAAIIAEPNNAVGSYTVVASAPGLSPVSFALTNTGPVFTSLIVNTTSGSLLPGTGLLSLPEAVQFANFDLGNANISFDSTVFSTPQTITLTGTQLELSDTTGTETITGPAAGVTISAGGNSRVFQVDSGVTASLSGLTITDGSTSTGYGGGLENDGTVTLTNCTVSGDSGGGGAGVFNAGTATFIGCTLSGNTAYYRSVGNYGDYNISNGGGVLNASSANLTMTDCTVGGNSAGAGGGVDNSGTATLTDCAFTGNYAGGVFNGGTATLTDCTVIGNYSGGFGGGMSNDGKATLTDCTLSDNGGSGVFNGGTANLNDCTLSDNDDGGVSNGGTANLNDCTLSGNGFSGVSNGGTANLNDCTLSGNFGSGVFNGSNFDEISLSSASLTMTDCTLSGNSGGDGGGVFNFATANLTDCTISGNSATIGGGVEMLSGTANFTGCTVSGNDSSGRGGGLANYDLENFPAGTATLTDTIVAGNSDPSGASDIAGSDISGSYNLIGTGGSGGLVNGVDGNIVLTSLSDLDLAPLGNNGGPTETMALLAGSPAIGAGVIADYPGTTTPITTDQRGLPLDTPTPDIGAFQFQGSGLIALTFSGLSNPSITFGTPSVTISGTLANGSQAPVGETVAVTLNGDEQSAIIGSGGAFSTTFDTTVLDVVHSPYTVSYAYTSDGTFAPASTTSTLTVLPPALTTFTVNTLGDAGIGSGDSGDLRYCINQANIDGGANTILFDPTVFSTPQTIVLTGTQLELSDTGGTQTITGPAAGVTISGGGASAVFEIEKGVTAAISGLTISDGSTSGGSGGGLLNYGTVTLTDCTISGNSAGGEGGGVFNDGTASLTDCTISGNSSGGPDSSGSDGGGVFNFQYANLTLTDCTVSGNSAYDGGGGGVGNFDGTITLTNCTVNGNSTRNDDGGGVLSYSGTVDLTDCTISGNYAGDGGGGLASGTTFDVTAFNLTDTIIAANTDPSGPSDILVNSNVSGSDNLIGTGGSGGLVNGVDGNIVLTSLAALGLAPLASNGGPTQTMALLPASAAIGAGVIADYPGTTTPITTDQRGLPLDSPNPDIGAFQTQASALTRLTFSGISEQSITYGTPSVTISGTLADGSQAPVGRDRRRYLERRRAVGHHRLRRRLLHHVRHHRPQRGRLRPTRSPTRIPATGPSPPPAPPAR